MITDFIVIELSDEQLKSVYENAKAAMIGGASNIRIDDRMDRLYQDQVTAQAGEAALSILITGDIELYKRTRAERNKNKYKGDDGSDLLGYKIDVKTSRMRYGENRLYNLWVRPREYHKDVVYYLALMNPTDDKKVFFVGWVQGEYMEFVNDKYEVRQDRLNGMQAGQP